METKKENLFHEVFYSNGAMQPPPSGWRNYYGKFMLLWAVVSHVWILVQAIKIFETQDAKSISLPAFIILFVSGVIWFIYGFFVIKNRVIVISSIVSLTLGILVLIGIAMYS